MTSSPSSESVRVVAGPITEPAPDAAAAAEEAAGLDRHVGGDLDLGVDPGRCRVDDRHPREHVGLEDPAAGLLPGRGRGRRGC